MAQKLRLATFCGIAPALRGGAVLIGGIAPALRGGAMLMLALASLVGCKGCSDGTDTAPTAPQVERREESERARVLSRLSARRLDRDKAYPKDADGSVKCDTDVDCFLVQAERCATASLTHTVVTSGYGLKQRVQARYRIGGKEADRCKVERHVLALETDVDPVMVEALRKAGKTGDQIEATRDEALEALRHRNPAHLECFFDEVQLLETTMNLADGRFDQYVWRNACRELEGPAPATPGAGATPSAAHNEQAAPPAAQEPPTPAPRAKP
jgi:hypothetical protein